MQKQALPLTSTRNGSDIDESYAEGPDPVMEVQTGWAEFSTFAIYCKPDFSQVFSQVHRLRAPFDSPAREDIRDIPRTSRRVDHADSKAENGM